MVAGSLCLQWQLCKIGTWFRSEEKASILLMLLLILRHMVLSFCRSHGVIADAVFCGGFGVISPLFLPCKPFKNASKACVDNREARQIRFVVFR